MQLNVHSNLRLSDAVILALASKNEMNKITNEDGEIANSLKLKVLKFTDDLVEVNHYFEMESQLSALNKVCDKRLRALRRHLWALKDLDDPIIGPPTEVMFDLFDKYGIRMLSLPIDEQYSKMCGFRDDLLKPNIQECIAEVPICNLFVDAFLLSLSNYIDFRTAYFDFLTKRRTTLSGTQIKNNFRKFFNSDLSEFLLFSKKYSGGVYHEIYENLLTETNLIAEAVKRRHVNYAKKTKKEDDSENK